MRDNITTIVSREGKMQRKTLGGGFLVGRALIAMVLLVWSVVLTLSEAASADSKNLLQQLVEGARREGQLDLMVLSSMGEKGARELTDAFKRRFGLGIRMNADLSGQEPQQFNYALNEVKSGIPPTLDLMEGGDENVLWLSEAGGADPIENWEALLAFIAPEAYKIKDKISPSVLSGYGFVWLTRTVVLVYNPKLISRKELPKTWKEMGSPKYSGAFSLPPWTSVALMGLLKYDKGELLDIVKSWGRNKKDILTYAAGTQRVLLGDIKFLFGNSQDYFREKARDPSAPIELTFFEDFTQIRWVQYVVRKQAKHPNAAKLFALWATSAEANRIFESQAFIENVVLGNGPVSGQFLKKLKEQNIRPVNWFDTSQNLEKFRWLSTAEGKEYAKALARAQREGR